MNWGALLGTVLVGCALAICWFLFALDAWLVLGAVLVYAALAFRLGFTLAFVGGFAYMGYGFTVPLFGAPLWVAALIPTGAILLLVFSVKGNAPQEVAQDG